MVEGHPEDHLNARNAVRQASLSDTESFKAGCYCWEPLGNLYSGQKSI